PTAPTLLSPLSLHDALPISRARGLHRSVDVRRVPLGHLGEALLGRRIDHAVALAARGRLPRVPDEEVRLHRLTGPGTPRPASRRTPRCLPSRRRSGTAAAAARARASARFRTAPRPRTARRA